MVPSPTKIKTVYSFVAATIMLDLNTPMDKAMVQQIHPYACQNLRQGNPEFNRLFYFASRVRQAGERVAADRNAIAREGWGYVVVRIIASLSLIAFLVLYAIHPTWLGVLSIQFPNWLRWIGIALGCASFVLYAWAQATLGKEWSPHLQMREQHHLVTTGPYARMRHPIYSAYIVFMTSIALVTANWFFIALLVVSIIVFAFRIPKEEQMLIEKFGGEYKTYMHRTGGLFPK